MRIEMLKGGKLATNCYLVQCEETSEIAVVDPIPDIEMILSKAEEMKGRITKIVNTHGHADHIAGNKGLKEATGCLIMVHQADAHRLTDTHDIVSQYLGLVGEQPHPDVLLEEGQHIQIGLLQLRVLHTPGHTPGSICLLGEGVLFSGDTLFQGSIGRYDLPGGDFDALKNSLKRLCELAPETQVLPGHGPATGIAKERKENPYL